MGRRWVAPAALLAGGVLISGFTLRRGIDAFDEGLVLQAARRLGDGQSLYSGDVRWAYGPAQPFLLAGLFKTFGISLLQWRILRVLADAAVALVVYVLLRRFAPPWVALLGWLAAACAMAEPRSANPFPFALLLALGAVAVFTGGSGTPGRRVAAAAALTALAAAFRLDFALYGAAAVVAVALVDLDAPWARRLRLAGGYAAAAAAFALLLYAPFLIDVGPGRLYDELIGTSLHDRDYWTLPFPFAYHGGLDLWPPGDLARDLKDVLGHYQPLVVALGLATGAAAALLLVRARATSAAVSAGLATFGIGSLSYLLSRTDEFHTQPLAVALAVLLPAAAVHGLRGGGRTPRALGVAAACLFAPVLGYGVANRVGALFDPPRMAAVHLDAADGVEAQPAEARALERVVAIVHARVPPGEPIYLAPRRSDLVAYSNSILYVLADRDNAAGRDFGLLARPAAQRRIVTRLRVAAPRVVVRWTDPLSSKREPNLRGRPTGERPLDDYLRRAYRPLERLHHYDVLVPRGS
jgi:hypothetical protein